MKNIKTTVMLDAGLFEKAKELTGLSKTSEVLNYSLKEMVERESFARLISLGGSMPDAWAPDRRAV